MDTAYLVITFRLLAAILAGGIIGLERSYHGRSAGFRTHTLVCLASTLLMLLTAFKQVWLPAGILDPGTNDPTRMAQGIMTGIGFLGAGVIFKEGLSVRGLTTAASIWITAAIGLLLGVGFYFPAALAAILTLTVLSLFRWIEVKMPTHFYATVDISFNRARAMQEVQLRALLRERGFNVTRLDYSLAEKGALYGYHLTVRTNERDNISRLAETLREMKVVREYGVSLNSD